MRTGSSKLLFENLDLISIHPILWTDLQKERPGRLLFTYGLSRGAEKAVTALVDPSMEFVVVSIERLRSFCRREKGVICKKIRVRC